MRRFITIALTTLLLAACQTAPRDTATIEQVLDKYFAGIANNDQAAAQAACTDDYTLVENGKFWNNDSLFAFIAPLFEQGATIAFRFEGFKTSFHGNTAWTYYHNYALMTIEDEETPFHWAESAIFTYAGGQWQLALLHSTPIEE